MPESLINTVTYSELEGWVCGKNEIDVELLQQVAFYKDTGAESTEKWGPDHPTIKNFWTYLENEEQDMKKSFIRFCWG